MVLIDQFLNLNAKKRKTYFLMEDLQHFNNKKKTECCHILLLNSLPDFNLLKH